MPVRPPVDFAALQQRSLAFARAASMRDTWHLPFSNAGSASAALALGHELWVARRRLTSRRALYGQASEVAWESSLRARIAGATEADARAIRAVVRAHVMQTSLARSTVARVLALGGWYAQVALPVLEHAR